MTTEVTPLLAGQVVAKSSGEATLELVQVLQEITTAIEELQAMQEAIAAVSSPSGGGTQDAEARTAIASIIGAAT
jgi:hypothetical protein